MVDYEFFDKKALSDLVNANSTPEMDENYNIPNNHTCLDTLIENCTTEGDLMKNKLIYSSPNHYSREYAKNSAQLIKKDLKLKILAKNSYDFDIRSCYPTILYNIVKSDDFSKYYISEDFHNTEDIAFNDKEKEVIEEFKNAKEEIYTKLGKVAYICLTAGVSFIDDIAGELFIKMIPIFRKLKKKFLLDEFNHRKFLNRLFQMVERKALEEMYDIVKEDSNVRGITKMFDGLLIQTKKSLDIEAYEKKLSNKYFTVVGKKLK